MYVYCTVFQTGFGVSPVLTDILWATILPPITARAVQSACPNVPPMVIPTGFCIDRGERHYNIARKEGKEYRVKRERKGLQTER